MGDLAKNTVNECQERVSPCSRQPKLPAFGSRVGGVGIGGRTGALVGFGLGAGVAVGTGVGVDVAV